MINTQWEPSRERGDIVIPSCGVVYLIIFTIVLMMVWTLI